MKKLYALFLLAFVVTSTIIAQKTLVTENFGGSYAHNESMSTNSSGWTHTGTGDFVHKIVSGAGASGSNCFAQLGTSGAASASHDIQLYAGNTYEFKAYVKTVNSRIYVTLRINSGGTDVATSGNTSANGSWEELSCSYTPAADEMASFQFVKTQGQLANIDKIKVICTSCPDKNYVFDFNDSKEGWLSGGGCNVTLGNDAMNINATGNNVLVRSGSLTADLGLTTTDYDRARVTFRTPYAASGAGAGKLYFYSLSGGNSQFAVFDITRDAANTTTFQTVEIDLTAAPTTGNYTGSIARLGFRAPWGIASGDICHLEKVELFNQPQAPVPALTLTGIMDFGLSGSSGKALMLTANQSISDLSAYGVGSANNGGGTDGQEYTFPAVSVSAGQHVVLCRDQAALSGYFSGCLEQFNGALFPTVIIESSSEPSGNGNDAYELFHNGNVIETFGDINSSAYTYRDSWAWKDTAAANVGNWVFGGNDCSDNSSSTQTSNCPFPLATTPCVATYDVTLKVNTANITVGANGMYAGGGFLGGSDALQLTDADGDGTWEGVATISAGSGPNYYAFFNSPSHGSDWGTKENLAGQTCGISSNYNDRVLPTITSDTTIQHCFGNCAFDGTCNPPVTPTYDLTLSVNTAGITVGSNGMYAGGGILGDAMAVQLFDADGDGTWTGTVTMNTGVTGNYIFLNSPSHGGDWGTKEDLSGLACSDPANYNDRILPVIISDTTMLHCFGSCETDGTCPAPPSVFYNVTFQVDASNITVGSNGIYAGGGVLGDAMAYPLSDADGDGVWEATISLADGTSGNYIFLNSPSNGGDWGAKEDLSGLPCADPANWNDRILPAVTADVTIPYCFGTCDATCPTPPGCYYTVAMVDSYGDGWNGGSIDVSIGGNVVANWTLTGNTASGTDSVYTVNGDNVSFTWNSGFYDSEVSFTITDPAGTTIYTGGAPPAGSNFLSDVSVSSCQPSPVNITFQVDMGQVTSSFTTPEINGSWNNWAGASNQMTDADGDNVWEGTISLLPGSYEYKFAADNWSIQETNDPNAPCTNGDPVYTNRTLVVGNADATLSAVCWGSCDPCVYAPVAGTCGFFNLELTDSYGDGWNGGSLDVVVNGTTVFAGLTIVTGNGPDVYQIPVDIGDVVDFIYTAGSWSGENAYQVFDQNGVLIVDQGAGSSTPNSVSGVSACPACPEPTGLTASNITSSSADLSWTPGGSEAEWYVIVNGAGTSVSTASYTVTGLVANTLYNCAVHAICAPGDTSVTASTFSFTTPCSALTAPIVETFDNGMPSCWSEYQTSGSGWVFSGNPGYVAASNGRPSGTYAWIDFSGTDVGAILEGPSIDVSALTTPQLRFNYFSANTNNTSVNELYVETFDGNNWIAIDTISQLNPGWLEHTTDLSASIYNNTLVKVRFRAESGGATTDYYSDILLDDFEVRETPSCVNPTQLVSSNVTTSSVDFGWTAAGTETVWNVEYGLTGYTLGTGTVLVASTNPFTISGLTDNSSYDLYVQADCGGSAGVSPWSGPITVTTQCLAITAPTNETFDAGFSNCWSQETNDDFDWTLDAGGTPSSGTGPSDDFTGGGNYMFIEASSPRVAGDFATMYSEKIDISGLSTPQLRFLNHMYGAATGTLSVDLWDATTGTNLGTVFTHTGDRGNQWNEELISLSTTATIIQFSITAIRGSSWSSDIAIDEFGVSEAPACPDPTALAVSNITTSSADLSWTAGGTETAWNVEYGTTGFTLGTGTLTPTTTTTISMTSLTDLTSYDVYVQSDCGNGQTSSWVGPLTFTTPIANGCNHTLNMFDSYGDGWNGSAVDVTVNGVTVVSGATIPNGSTATASFSASTGSTIALANWVTGSWTTEVSWNISDVNGNVIANGVFSDTPSVSGNCQPPSFNDPLIGTWKLAQIPGAMGVGPNQGDVSWWSSSLGDVTTRACLFDDSIHFDSTGGYTHFMDGNTWVEGWQDGAGDGCRAPVAPHDGLGSYNYYYDSSTNTLTLNGLGAHLGLPKVTNTGEINNPQLAASSVSYVLTFSNNGNTMTADIDFGGGWWRFVYDNTSYQAPPSSYNVTLKVNTATITVGPNGMYAGGGVLGDALAIPLSDADGDGTWEGVAQFPAGGGHYVFLNSPSNGGDWGAKEDLSGQPCGDPNNWNDRLMPPIASDTTVLHCFGSCETDGSCPAPPPVPSCNYTIDMQDSYGDGWNGASVDVSVNGTVVANWGLASGSAGSDSIATINGDVVDFSFNSGAWDSEITFQITDPTGSQLGTYGPSPATGLFLTDTSAAICQPTTVNVTFQVDMGQVTAAFTTPEVNGSWNNWSAGTAMTDANGDGIWDATIALLSGNYEYKFAADGWTIQEMNDPNAPCTNGDPIYTNRVLSVGTVDMVIPNVCWGSCTPCFYSPQPPAGLTCAAGNPGLGFSDDIVPANGWSGDIGTGNGIWRVNSGGTTSGSTGPTGAHSGPDYLYFESSTGGLDTATAVTPMIDLTAATSDAELTFWMHAYGVAIGTLDVGVSTSATGPFTSVFNSTGPVQTPTDPWAQIGINIASYVGQQIYVGFTYARDTTGATSYQGDLAIDLIEVHACFNCLAPSGLTASNVTGSSADVSWTAGGTETEWFLIVNGAGTTQTSTTASLTGLMANTTYTCQVHAVCAPGDTSAASPAMSFTTLCNVAMAPTNETFDAGFSNCWSQETADDFDWTLDAGGTPSGGTGPSDDFTGGGNYMYTEASVPRAYGDVATMYSEVIDISGLTNPELRFLNHMYGNAMGTLSVDLWDASTGTNLGTVFTHTGDRGDVWNEELIMLSTTASTVQFSITAVLDSNAGGQTWPGDMAIDEFGVREAAANDLAIVAAVAPSGCDLTAAEPIEVWVVNQGLSAESNFDVSYGVNGGAVVIETIAGPLNPGDTAMYVFTATADMSADGIYDVALHVDLPTDNDTTDNNYMTSGENYYTPMAPAMTMGDTICNGDTAYIGAVSDGYIYWYDAATSGNLVGEGDYIDVMPTTTTSYFAEAAASEGHFEDFDSYNVGDYIVASDPANWAVWPGGTPGGAYDMQIDDAQGNGGNSLRVFNSDGTDVVLEFGEAFSTGKFYYSMDMYIVADGYINFQEQVTIGAAWNMSVTFIGGVINIDIDGTSVLTGSYPTTPTGGPMWNTFEFECDYSTGTWEVFTNGTSQGTFVNADPVASVNIYPGAGVEYYLDNVEWGALKDDACRSASRTEAVVTVEDCSNINELAKGNLDIYPNPNNGLFTISNSEDIVKVTVTDVHGKIVQSINEINLNKIDVDLTNLERGMYMVNVETNNGTVMESVIVQ